MVMVTPKEELQCGESERAAGGSRRALKRMNRPVNPLVYRLKNRSVQSRTAAGWRGITSLCERGEFEGRSVVGSRQQGFLRRRQVSFFDWLPLICSRIGGAENVGEAAASQLLRSFRVSRTAAAARVILRFQ